MPKNYPDWNTEVTPDTHAGATASRFRTVSGVPAIRVRGATYRGSQPINGVFELVDCTPQQVNGEDRFEVYCSWFGVKPPNTYPRIFVNPNEYEIMPDYCGEVIDDISA
jgi:hypothetical protein